MLPPSPKPYQMCSQQECAERERTGEVSLWERLTVISDEDPSEPLHNNHRPIHERNTDRGRDRDRGRNHQGRGDNKGRWSSSGRGRSSSNNNKSSSASASASRSSSSRRWNNPRQQQHLMDPCKAIQKYRRSAAGTETPLTRSPADLQVTVDYLLHLFVHFCDPTQKEQPQHSSNSLTSSFASFIEFWENRVRAVQVDFVKLQHINPPLQASLVRAHILILYLLSSSTTEGSPSSSSSSTTDPKYKSTNNTRNSRIAYEASFGKRALGTALAQFWKHQPPPKETSTGSATTTTPAELIDEMLVYDALRHVQTMVTHGEINIHPQFLETYHQILLLVRQKQEPRSLNDENSGHKEVAFPGFQWVLHDLVPSILAGNWARVLSQLSQPEPPTNTQFSRRVWILAKCLLAPTLSTVRWKALQTYNVTWMKGESVDLNHVAKLLYLSESEAAAWIQACGLPTQEQQDPNTSHQHMVTFKTLPIQPFEAAVSSNQDQPFYHTRQNDGLVFGKAEVFLTEAQGIRLPSVEVLEMLLLQNDEGHQLW